MSERKFKLLKDLPFVKAGTIYKSKYESNYYPDTLDIDYLTGKEIEKLSFTHLAIERLLGDWFEEVKEDDGRYTPVKGEKYYEINISGVMSSIWDGSYVDMEIYNQFNLFPTPELAKECAVLCLETRKKFFKERVKGYKNEA